MKNDNQKNEQPSARPSEARQTSEVFITKCAFVYKDEKTTCGAGSDIHAALEARGLSHAFVPPVGECGCACPLCAAGVCRHEHEPSSDAGKGELIEIATVVPNMTGERAQVWIFGEIFVTHSEDVGECFELRDHINEVANEWLRAELARRKGEE